MVTNEHHASNKLHLDYTHKRLNHREKEYVRREDIVIHTNSIEGFWNILKRKVFQNERFADALANCEGT